MLLEIIPYLIVIIIYTINKAALIWIENQIKEKIQELPKNIFRHAKYLHKNKHKYVIEQQIDLYIFTKIKIILLFFIIFYNLFINK